MIRLLFLSGDSTENLPLVTRLTGEAGIQCVSRGSLEECEAVLAAGWFDLCLVRATVPGHVGHKKISWLRERQEDLVILVLAPAADKEWKDSLVKSGADLVLEEDPDPDSLLKLIRRLGASRAAPELPTPPSPHQPFISPLSHTSALDLFRDVSRVLSEPGDTRRLTDRFLFKIRDLIGIPRMAVFLEVPESRKALVAHPESPPGRLPCVSAFGLSEELRRCLELTRESGLGKCMMDQSTVVQLQQPHPLGGEWKEASREISIVGGVAAIPINDRVANLGVVVLGDRLTGPLEDHDLQVLTLLFEEFGVALRNRWLEQERREEKSLLEDIFGAIHTGCLVLNAAGDIVECNRAFETLMEHRNLERGRFTLRDLPVEIRETITAAREEKQERQTLTFVDEKEPLRTFQVSILPLGLPLATPRPLLVVVEDITAFEQRKDEAVRHSRADLSGQIAKRFAHEIRNSLVPLTTHLQLFEERMTDPDFLQSLQAALGRESARIQRFTDQMLYFSPRRYRETRKTDLLELLKRAQEQVIAEETAVTLEVARSETVNHVWVEGEDQSLEHALVEVLLNAQQAMTGKGRLKFYLSFGSNQLLELHILSSGELPEDPRFESWFEPFYTSRNTGIGLGLSVARKIIEEHGGSLHLREAEPPYTVQAEISLPYQELECETSTSPTVSG